MNFVSPGLGLDACMIFRSESLAKLHSSTKLRHTCSGLLGLLGLLSRPALSRYERLGAARQPLQIWASARGGRLLQRTFVAHVKISSTHSLSNRVEGIRGPP
jgi:hypothetical protein